MVQLQLSKDMIKDFPESIHDVLETESGLDLARKWALCQSMSVYDQLRAGIRFLDLRVCMEVFSDPIPKPSWFFVCHSLLGNPLESILADIDRFLTEANEEILIVALSPQRNFHGIKQAEMVLADLIERKLGHHLLPGILGFNITYGNVLR